MYAIAHDLRRFSGYRCAIRCGLCMCRNIHNYTFTIENGEQRLEKIQRSALFLSTANRFAS